MEKINLGVTIPAYPMPVSLVGTMVEGRPNFMAVAWFTMASYKPPKIAVVLGKGHYTNPGIRIPFIFFGCTGVFSCPWVFTTGTVSTI